MNEEDFEAAWRSARFHHELPAVVRYRNPENQEEVFVAWSFSLRRGALTLFGTHPVSLDILLSDVTEVY